MASSQFSIRALLLAIGLAALTVGLAQKAPLHETRNGLASLVAVMLTSLIGPPAFALMGYLVGLEYKSPWIGTIAGAILGTVFWFTLFYAPSHGGY